MLRFLNEVPVHNFDLERLRFVGLDREKHVVCRVTKDAILACSDAGDAPAIIAETRVDIPTSSVSDAVMMLDLRDTNALLFVNSKTGSHNMVYRRRDAAEIPETPRPSQPEQFVAWASNLRNRWRTN